MSTLGLGYQQMAHLNIGWFLGKVVVFWDDVRTRNEGMLSWTD